MTEQTYTDRQATDDAKGILEGVIPTREYTDQTREALAEILKQIVERELTK